MYRTRREQRQLDVVARSERQGHVRGGIYHCVQLGRISLQNRRGASDFDRLRYLTHFHSEVDARRLIEHEYDGGVKRGLKSRSPCLKAVGSNGNTRQIVCTRSICLGRPHRAPLLIRDGDGRSSDGGTTGVFD